MRRVGAGVRVWAVGCLLALGCGDDDGNRVAVRDGGSGFDAALVDAGGLDGAVAPDAGEQAVDAGEQGADAAVQDAGVDLTGDAQTESVAACPLRGGELAYRFHGGNARIRTSYTVSARGVFRRERTGRTDGGAEICLAELPCGTPAVDGDDLSTALLAPDVQAAFTSDATKVLGLDTTIWDGSVLIIERVDGKRIAVGDECTADQPGCVPIPAGVTALSTLLFQLSSEQAASGPCQSMLI